MTFEPVQSYTRVRLSDVVSDQIKALIAKGELSPGQRLPAERDLSVQLNVSRASLREALVRLQADRYIVSEGRGGFVVADITHEFVSNPLVELIMQRPSASVDVLELRLGMEGLATELATQRATRQDLERIRDAFETLRAHTLKIERAQLAAYDARFHLAIAAATHNFAIIHVMNGLHGLVRESMRKSHGLYDYDHEVELELLAQHEQIFDRVMTGDAAGARKAAEEHLIYVQTLYERHAATQGDLTRDQLAGIAKGARAVALRSGGEPH